MSHEGVNTHPRRHLPIMAAESLKSRQIQPRRLSLTTSFVLILFVNSGQYSVSIEVDLEK